MKKLLIILAVFLLIGCSFNDTEDYTYNGYSFVPVQDFWGVTINTIQGETNIIFHHHPSELELYEFDENTLNYFNNVHRNEGDFLIGISEELSTSGVVALAGVEVSKVTGKVLGMETKSGFTTEDFGTRVVNCDNASTTKFVLVFKLGEENSIITNYYCSIITANETNNLIELADLFVYKILGIM